MSINFLSIPPKKLSRSITSASSSFKLNNIKSWKRNALGVTTNLVAGDFGTTAYGCFRNDTGTKIEIFEFDPATIASASITITRRGLDFNGDLTTETSNYKLDWSANETTVQLGTDVPQLFQYLKEYIDAASIAGAVDASESAKGIVEEATDAETAAGTATGGTGAKLFVSPAKLATQLSATLSATTDENVTTKFSNTEVFNGTGPASWTDLDLSSVVGATQKMVLLKFITTGANVNVGVKTNGDTDSYDVNTGFHGINCILLTANDVGTTIVKTDTAGVIEWIAAAQAFTVDVLAYW